MVVAFFLAGCHGQGNARSFTYRLRKPQNEQGYSTLHTMRDGALLVATKRLEQPKQIWTLTRIEAWDTSQPREDELDIDVGPNDELLGWLSQKDRSDRNDQLLMDPGGNYLVVRLSQNADTWNFPLPRPICKAAVCSEHYRSPRVQASQARRAHRSPAGRRRHGFQPQRSLRSERPSGLSERDGRRQGDQNGPVCGGNLNLTLPQA